VPVLVGYTSGATLVFATLTQAPIGTFAGAISMGFCPDQDFGGATLCPAPQLHYTARPQGRAAVRAGAAPRASLDCVAGPRGHRCARRRWSINSSRTRRRCRCGALPRVGHSFSVERDWLPQLLAAYKSIATRPEPTAAQAPEIQDLPVTNRTRHRA